LSATVDMLHEKHHDEEKLIIENEEQ